MLILWLMGLLPWDEQRDVDWENDDLLDMEEEILEGGNNAADVLKVQLSEPVYDGSVLLKAEPSGGKSMASQFLSPSADKGQHDASTNNGQLDQVAVAATYSGGVVATQTCKPGLPANEQHRKDETSAALVCKAGPAANEQDRPVTKMMLKYGGSEHGTEELDALLDSMFRSGVTADRSTSTEKNKKMMTQISQLGPQTPSSLREEGCDIDGC
jgi:hypothetical protein